MALVDYVQRTRAILLGYGIGELPVLRQVAADAVNTVSGQTVAITFVDGTEAGKIKPGDVLATYGATTAATAWVGYVVSVSSAIVTCINGFLGSTAITNAATTHDGEYLQVLKSGQPSDFEIFKAIEVVENTLLWPHIYKVEFDTEASPSMSTMRVDLDATVEEIDQAWQIVGNERYSIPHSVETNAPSEADNNTAGVVGVFDLINGSTLYLKTIRRMVVGTDESTYSQLTELVSTAAAAIAGGWQRPEATLAMSKQDSRDRGRAPDVGAALWRDFFTLRTEWADDLARDRVDEIEVKR